MNRYNTLKNILYLTTTSIFIIIFLLEIILRYIFPACEKPWRFYCQRQQVTTFDIRGPKEGLFTIGPFARKGGKWRINNFGWNSNINYFKDRKGVPLIAIIGDSYIEAFQVDNTKNIAARLREKLSNRYDVYSFGMSGAPLSAYLQISRYVRDTFKPDIIIINVVHNDFDESLCFVKNQEGFLCLEVHNSKINEAAIKSFVPLMDRSGIFNKCKRELYWHSGIIRYLLYNLHLYQFVHNIIEGNDRRNIKYNANIDVDCVKKLQEDISRAVGYLLQTIRKENNNIRVIVMIDGPRRDIYNKINTKSNVLWLNDLLKKQCNNNRMEFIDLTSIFIEDYKQHNKMFNNYDDYHWNEYGHLVVANALWRYLCR